MRYSLAVLLIALPLLGGDVKTGGSKMIDLDGGKYHVWTKRVGSGPVKLLLLHGGPGFPHDYFECFEDFLPKHNVEFFYYDQLGVGNSDVPNDDSLWTVERYRNEIRKVHLTFDNGAVLNTNRRPISIASDGSRMLAAILGNQDPGPALLIANFDQKLP